MTIQTSTIRPGLLVVLKTTVDSRIRYSKTTIQDDTDLGDGGLTARWETERHIPAPEEHREASRIRSKARKTVARACIKTTFGLVCPQAKETELRAAIDVARAEVDEFNRKSLVSRIDIFVPVGRIASDDAEAIGAISAEIKELLNAMQAGVTRLDPDAIRKAASATRAASAMLSAGAQARVSDAIAEARAVANKVAKAGELTAEMVNVEALKAIDMARAAFLDLGEADALEVEAPAGRAVDLDPEITGIWVDEADEIVAAARVLDIN